MKKAGKIIAFSLLGLLAFSLIAAFVSANAFTDLFGTNAKEIFSSWSSGQLNLNVAKILFFILVAMVIYSLATKLPGIKNLKEGVQIAFALIGSFLATAYLTPSEVYVMLSSWSAMGITFGIIIPFIIMTYFTYDLLSDIEAGGKQKLGNLILSYLIWVVFIGAMGYRLIEGLNDATMPQVAWLITGGMILLAIIIILCMTWIQKKLSQMALKSEVETAHTTMKESTAQIKMLSEQMKALSERQKGAEGS
jgi:uncharacterized membrane protein YjgN (DUF898 family)